MSNLHYLSYSTGTYGNGKYPGMTMQFACVDTAVGYHVHFNVDLERKRRYQSYKKGSPLPQGHFTPKPNSYFVNLWKSTSLPMPRSLTSFHDFMGKLKPILFQATISKGTRLDAGTLRPIFLTDNSLINAGQSSDKFLTTLPDRDIASTPKSQCIERISGTCGNNHVTSQQVSESVSNSINYIDIPRVVNNKSNEEWLEEYNKFSKECDDLF